MGQGTSEAHVKEQSTHAAGLGSLVFNSEQPDERVMRYRQRSWSSDDGLPETYEECAMNLVVLLIVLLLVFGGGGFYLGGPAVGGSLGGILLLVLIVLLVTGRLGTRA